MSAGDGVMVIVIRVPGSGDAWFGFGSDAGRSTPTWKGGRFGDGRLVAATAVMDDSATSGARAKAGMTAGAGAGERLLEGVNIYKLLLKLGDRNSMGDFLRIVFSRTRGMLVSWE